MNVKIIAHFFAIACLVSCRAFALSVPPHGCYECEEEVWEEVPCDEIPTNATTTTTTTSTTTTSTTTSTTPRPDTTTTEDPYKKCYCECKVGCKEFCRKVSVNPEPKKQILQISKITEPITQGRLESTHYHQRELIPKKTYGSSYNPRYLGSKSYSALSPDTYKHIRPSEEHPSRHYNKLPSSSFYVNTPGASAYAKAQAAFNKIDHDQSYGSNKPHFSEPQTSSYDVSIPYSNAYSKLTKRIQDPSGNNIKLSVATSNSIPDAPYSAHAPVKSPELGSPSTVGIPSGYDSVESYIKDIIQGSVSTNYHTFDGYGGRQYSMSFR